MNLWSIVRLLIYISSLSESVRWALIRSFGLGNWKFSLVGKRVGDSPLTGLGESGGMILKWVLTLSAAVPRFVRFSCDSGW